MELKTYKKKFEKFVFKSWNVLFQFLFLLALPPSECATVPAYKNISFKGCVSEAPVDVGSCSGHCSSNTTAMMIPPYYQSNCLCCKPTQLRPIKVLLSCGKNDYLERQLAVITACSCEQCSYEPIVMQEQPQIETRAPQEIRRELEVEQLFDNFMNYDGEEEGM